MPKVALVTGGGRGLGRLLVDAFKEKGFDVAACGRHEPGEDFPGEFFVCDVREPDQVASMVDAVAARFSRIDVLVNNAGGTPYLPASEMSPQRFERVVSLNLVAPFYVSQRVNDLMQAQETGGIIINIGSAVYIRPSVNVSAYVAAKAGLIGLTKALSLEWAPKVRVNQVTVGLLRTELVEQTYGKNVAAVEATVPMGRFATGDDVAAACMVLTSPEMSYTTGAELLVDGGGEIPSWLLKVEQ